MRLNHTFGHFTHPITAQDVSAVHAQAAAGHERGVAEDEIHGPDYIVHTSGTAQKRMVADGLLFVGAQ